MKPPDHHPRMTIFVSIAAYRDSEAPHTVNDLFEKADHPERVFVGVLSQIDLERDQHFRPTPRANLHEEVVPYTLSQGACWARHKVMTQMLGDQEFALQIDSHMRFDKGWDTRLIAQWYLANDPMAVLTHYPMPYDSKTNVCNPQMFTNFICKQFDTWGIPKVESNAFDLMDAPGIPRYTIFLAGGCYFGKASTFRQVPYDPHLYFSGEEINYAVRLWTHGYNLYLPTHPFTYHDYGVDRGRRLHWVDQDTTHDRALASARLRYLLGIDHSAPQEALVNLEKYSLGTVRSLAQWQIQHGLHFKRQLICANVTKGEFN